jgi:eukaryotic-like serine/threonine-protein kinase
VDEAAPPPTGRYVQEEEVVEPPPRRPLLWPWLLLLLLLVGAALALAYFLTRDDDSDAETVPQVVGLREPVAVDRLRHEGYPSDVRRVVTQSGAGRVLRQQPAAGEELDPGGTVVLIVARGPNTVDVPNVVGLRGTAACERLQAERLRCDSTQVFARRARGIVVRQVPAANAEARRGSPVRIQVSKGPQLVVVPTVIGRSEAQATGQLRRLGFRPNTVRVAANDPPGTVIAQNPQPNAKAPKGSIVRINVSRGPAATTTTGTTTTAPTPGQATVPNVIGQNETDAAETVRSAGFRVEKRAQTVTDPTQAGIVQRQDPPPNRRVRAGSLVIIFVGRLTGD